MIVTTRELVSRAMAAADMHDDFVTPAQWMHWATQENLALAIFLARASWTLNVATQTITVAGTEGGAFPLTAQPLAIVSVHQVGSQGLRRVEFNNAVDFLRQLPGTQTSSPPGDVQEFRTLWDQVNDTLVLNFYPEPRVGDSYVVSYIPHPARLVLGTPNVGEAAAVAYPLGFEERVILGMAKRALIKEESDTSAIQSLIAESERAIEDAAYSRVLSEAPSVRNSDYEKRGWMRSLVYPAVSRWIWV